MIAFLIWLLLVIISACVWAWSVENYRLKFNKGENVVKVIEYNNLCSWVFAIITFGGIFFFLCVKG